MKRFLIYIALSLISLVPLLWFRGDLIIARGDEAVFLNPGFCFSSIKWSWDSFFYNCGGANNSMPLLFPLSLFWFLFTRMGIGLAVIEKVWLVSVWFLTGFSMIYLARVLGLSLTASFYAMVLYMLNVFVAQQPLIYNFRLPYMVLPLLLALMIKGLALNTDIIRYSILFSLSTLLMASAWTNPPWALPSFILISFYLFYRFFWAGDSGERRRVFWFTISSAVFTLLLNLWWLIPDISSLAKSIGNVRGLNLNIFTGRGFYEIFRFLKSWAFGYSGYDYHKLYYDSWIIILSSFVIPIIVFSSLFRNKRGFRDYWFFIFLSLLMVFLAKGPLPPFGGYYNYLFKNFPGFVMFREPYTKFMPLVILAFAILFGDSVNWVCGILKNRFRRYISISFSLAALFIVGTVSFPMFTKNIFWQRQGGWKQNKGERSSYVEVPRYWITAGEWFNDHFKKGRLFHVPRSTGVYNWNSGFNCGGSAAGYLLNVPVISCSGNSNMAVRLLNLIYDAFVEKDIDLYGFLRIFNVSFILHDKDIYTNTNWRFHDMNFLPPAGMKKRLQRQKKLELCKTIGNLDIYKARDEFYLPVIYAADNLSYIDGTVSDMILQPLEGCYLGHPAILVEDASPIKTLPADLVNRINNYIYVSNKIKYGGSSSVRVLQSGVYDVFLKLVPNFTDLFEAAGAWIGIDLAGIFSKSRYNPGSIPSYDCEIYPNGITLTLPFDGSSKEDEYLQIKDFNPDGRDIDIDLLRYPYLGLCYRVDDPRIQTLQVVLGVDFDEDNKVDFWLRNIYENPAPSGFSYFYYDVCSKARRIKLTPYCHVIKLEIYPHKLWGVDCSQRPGYYKFYIKDLRFFNNLSWEKEFTIKDRAWDKSLSEKDTVMDSRPDGLTAYVEPIDVIKYNLVEFQWRNIGKDTMINTRLVLDLNNDGAADREEAVYSFNASTDKVSHLINFRDVMSMGYEGIANVRLLAVNWVGPGLRPEDIRAGFKRLIVYRQKPVEDYRDFYFKDYVFSLNGERYMAEFSSLGNSGYNAVVADYKDVFLPSGRNIVGNLLTNNDPFNLEWIYFKKSIQPQAHRRDLPRIKWEKINPARYLVRINNASGPFLLVFSESLHKGWKAYIWPNGVSVKNHIPVNGYAQGWWVEWPSSDFQVLIKYEPQDWTNIGWGISGLTLLGCLIYIWYRR